MNTKFFVQIAILLSLIVGLFSASVQAAQPTTAAQIRAEMSRFPKKICSSWKRLPASMWKIEGFDLRKECSQPGAEGTLFRDVTQQATMKTPDKYRQDPWVKLSDLVSRWLLASEPMLEVGRLKDRDMIHLNAMIETAQQQIEWHLEEKHILGLSRN